MEINAVKENALIVFLKYPERGRVKTRLAKLLGEEFTFELYKHFIKDIMAACEKVNAETFIAYSISDRQEWDNPLWTKGKISFPQQGRDLGEKMYNAFEEVQKRGFFKMALIGSDSPDLEPRIFTETFNKLETADAVLGPSGDGGYYLIGFRSSSLDFAPFEGITWSTDSVCAQTLKKMDNKGLSCSLLAEHNDLDEACDLKDFYTFHLKKGTRLFTMDYLCKNSELLFT